MIIQTTKYKTHIISVRFKAPIKQAEIGLRALLPQVMSSQSPLYNSRLKLSEALDDLYGASLVSRTYRQGMLSIVEFSINFISPRFSDEPLLEKVLTLLADVIYGHKNLPKGEFEVEKRMAIEKIMAFQNDKTNYAISRLVEVMFKDDIQSLRPQGKIEDIKAVTYPALNQYYKRFIKGDIDVVLSGDYSEADLKLIHQYFNPKYTDLALIDEVDKPHHYQEITETDHISQAKVNIGYLLPIRYHSDDFYPAVIFNSIFGGGVHSRLFLNVREKHSLCYYIRSIYDPFKGFMIAYAGIDKSRVDLALEVIDQQLTDLKENLVLDHELMFAKQTFINAIKEQEDHQVRQMDAFYIKTLLKLDPIDTIIEKINRVTKEEIKKVANKVLKDTLYILAPEV